MTIRKVFLLLITLLVTILLIGGGGIVSKNLEVLSRTRLLEHKEISVLNRAHELKLAVVQVQQWLTDISATRGRDGLDDGFDEAADNAKRFKQLISELVALDPENSDRYNAMLPIFDTYYRDGKKMAHAYIEQGPAGGNKIMAEFDESAEKISETVDKFLVDIGNSTNHNLFILKSSSQSVLYSVIVVFFIVFVVVITLYFVMSRAIKSLRNVKKAIGDIASGDLSTKVYNDQSGEIGDLLRNVEQMRFELQKMVSQINSASISLRREAEALSTITTQTNSDIGTQRGDLEQIASAISQLSTTTIDVAHNTNQAALASDVAARQGAEGITILEQNLSSIRELVTSVNETTEDVRLLRDKSKDIDKVLTVIWEITEQTNLLALNAAIEAARAGEAGRGFAVVADEVRGLAQRAQQSASEVQTMITEIQNSANSVNENMRANAEKALTTGQLSEKTKDAFDGISAAIEEIDHMMAQISTASEEQAQVTEDVNQKVRQINEISIHTTSNAEKLSSSSQELTRSSEILSKFTSQFKV